jgi:hypothetical protein
MCFADEFFAKRNARLPNPNHLWYEATDLANVFFSILIHRMTKSSLHLHAKSSNAHSLLFYCFISSTFCHKIDSRDLDLLDTVE